MQLPAHVAETVHKNDLIRSNDHVLVAVSGGPDSVALLDCLLRLGYNVEAAHLNHQFRGAESDEDADFVAALCKSLSVKVFIESVNVPKLCEENRVSAQQAARSARYAFLEDVRHRRNLDLIATAHNFDDRIETVLINILRGTGVDGLRGIPYRRGNIIRPLLDTPRAEVERYCLAQELVSRADSSNKLSKYTRNNVRSELLPYLERRYNTGIRQSLLRLSEIASDESDYLNTLAASWVEGAISIDVGRFRAEPIAFQRRILRHWIRQQVASELSDVTHLLIEQLRTKVEFPCAVTLPGGRLVVESNGLRISVRELQSTTANVLVEIQVTPGVTTIFYEYLVTIDRVGEGVDDTSLHIKQWADGDRITLKGGTKKVQDVFMDKKVPRETRRKYPIIADKDGIVAVGDIAIAARASGTKVTLVTED